MSSLPSDDATLSQPPGPHGRRPVRAASRPRAARTAATAPMTLPDALLPPPRSGVSAEVGGGGVPSAGRVLAALSSDIFAGRKLEGRAGSLYEFLAAHGLRLTVDSLDGTPLPPALLPHFLAAELQSAAPRRGAPVPPDAPSPPPPAPPPAQPAAAASLTRVPSKARGRSRTPVPSTTVAAAAD